MLVKSMLVYFLEVLKRIFSFVCIRLLFLLKDPVFDTLSEFAVLYRVLMIPCVQEVILFLYKKF